MMSLILPKNKQNTLRIVCSFLGRIWDRFLPTWISFLNVEEWDFTLQKSIFIKSIVLQKQLKVSRSLNKTCQVKTSPKNTPTNLFFYPDNLEIPETLILISSFKYFRVVRIENQICLFVFFGEITAPQFCFVIYWSLELITLQPVVT